MTIRKHLLIAAFALLPFSAQAEDTLYADLGGHDGVVKIAEATTDNFLADDRIKHTFDDTNMRRFRRLLAEQFCEVSGGPCKYTGRSMKEAHASLKLRNADFNAVVEDLQDAMNKLGVAFTTQNRLLARLAPMQRDVVTR